MPSSILRSGSSSSSNNDEDDRISCDEDPVRVIVPASSSPSSNVEEGSEGVSLTPMFSKADDFETTRSGSNDYDESAAITSEAVIDVTVSSGNNNNEKKDEDNYKKRKNNDDYVATIVPAASPPSGGALKKKNDGSGGSKQHDDDVSKLLKDNVDDDPAAALEGEDGNNSDVAAAAAENLISRAVSVSMIQDPGAYAIRGINAPLVDTPDGRSRNSNNLINENGENNEEICGDDGIVGTEDGDGNGNGDDTSGENCNVANDDSGNNDTSTTEQVITAHSEIMTTSTPQRSSSQGSSSTLPSSQRSSSIEASLTALTTTISSQQNDNDEDGGSSSSAVQQQLVITANVVDEEETERDRMELIAETEARVRRELDTSMVASQIVEAEIVDVVPPSPTSKKSTERRRCILISIVIVVIVIVAVVASISVTKNRINNNINENDDDESSSSSSVAIASYEKTCVEEKLDEWIELDTRLKGYLDNIMTFDEYKTVEERCESELKSYTEVAEKSCQLEKQYDSPLNYGDRWLLSSSVNKLLNDGSHNGAPYLDGRYRLAIMFDTTGLLKSLFPPPLTCYADCYTGIGNGCDPLLSLRPLVYHNNDYNVTTWFVKPEEVDDVPPELYCNVEWGNIDQAAIDLKLCAVEALGDDSTKSEFGYASETDSYIFAYEYEKEEQKTCSENYCKNLLPRPSDQPRECGKEKLNSFIDQNSWLKQYFDLTFEFDKYQIAAEGCKDEIQKFTEVAESSCHLENEYDSPWNYGDRWFVSATNYLIMNDGIANGACYTDGHYMLAAFFHETFNFTLPFARSHICLADCYLNTTTANGGGWNGKNDTCDFVDKPAPVGHELNPFGQEFLFTSQSTISTEMYCNIDWSEIDLAFIDIKICAARTIGEPFLLTQDEYVCFFEYEKFRNRACAEHYCGTGEAADDDDEYYASSNYSSSADNTTLTTLEEFCQISPERLDLVYTLSGTNWI